MLDDPEVSVRARDEGVVDLVAQGGAVAVEAPEARRDVDGQILAEAPGEGRGQAEADVVAAGLVQLLRSHGLGGDLVSPDPDPVKIRDYLPGQKRAPRKYSVASANLLFSPCQSQ